MKTLYDKDGICKICGSHANSHFTGDCKKKGDWCGIPELKLTKCPKCGTMVISQ